MRQPSVGILRIGRARADPAACLPRPVQGVVGRLGVDNEAEGAGEGRTAPEAAIEAEYWFRYAWRCFAVTRPWWVPSSQCFTLEKIRWTWGRYLAAFPVPWTTGRWSYPFARRGP